MKRKIALLLTGLLMTSSLTACGGDANEGQDAASTRDANSEVVIINYPTFQVGVNTAADVIAQLVGEFNELYEGKYQIQVEEIPGDANYVDKIKVQLGTGDLPPVIYGGGYNLLDLVIAKEMAVDLTDAVEADLDWKAMYSDASLQVNSRDGRIYASSVEGSVVGYFYNKEIFGEAGIEKPAETWEEFFEQCEALKAAGFTPLALDTADSAWVTQLWLGAIVGTTNEDGLSFMNTINPVDYNTGGMVCRWDAFRNACTAFFGSGIAGGL